MNFWNRSSPLKTLLGVLAAGILIWSVGNMRRSFQDSQPQWMHMEDRRGPSLRISPPFRRLIQESQNVSKSRQIPLGSIQYFEVEPDLAHTMAWTTQQAVNPGFSPMTSWESRVPAHDRRFMGFYDLEGKPFKYTVRNDPFQTNVLWATVRFHEPLPPGGALLLFRVQQQKRAIKPGKNGNYTVGIRQLPPVDNGIYSWGEALPKTAAILQYLPVEGTIVYTNDLQAVCWINALLGDKPPPLSLTFTLRK